MIDLNRIDGNKITPEIYLKMSTVRMNCGFYPWKSGLHVAIVTCKDIAKGRRTFYHIWSQLLETQ
jgi:hypothetical protein